MSAADAARRAARVDEAAGDARAPQAPDGGPWPRGVSRRAGMSIGAFVREVAQEFPAVSVSKVRFLEEQGLITPTRTGSGYRKYSEADVERLRYVLGRQRDAFLPLRVIREELEDLDAGREVVVEPAARVVARDGSIVLPEPTERVSVDRVRELTGADESLLDELVEAGLVVTDTRGRMTGRAVPIVAASVALAAHGLRPRHLRTVRMNAEREAERIDTVVAPVRARAHGAGREQASAVADELARLYVTLHSSLLTQALDRLD